MRKIYATLYYMEKSPLYYALSATAYIVLVVLAVHFGLGRYIDTENETLLVPMVMLSLLTLSVAVMGFLFFFEPAMYLMSGKKKEALLFFFRTLGIFAVTTTLLVIAMLVFA